MRHAKRQVMTTKLKIAVARLLVIAGILTGLMGSEHCALSRGVGTLLSAQPMAEKNQKNIQTVFFTTNKKLGVGVDKMPLIFPTVRTSWVFTTVRTSWICDIHSQNTFANHSCKNKVKHNIC